LKVILSALLLIAAPALASQKPKDFDRFWNETKKELVAIPLSPQLDPDPANTDRDVACFKASYVSLGSVVVHARYCRPTGPGPFPGVLISPWYSESTIRPPSDLAKKGIAALWYQGRGYEVDQSSYPVDNSWYILVGLQSPQTYVYRGIVSHALRGLDFLASRPEVDAKKLGAMGSSQGGGLSLLAAGLDKRVTAVAADFPFLNDWVVSMPLAKSPYADVRKYIEEHPGERKSVLKTVSYFDALDVADRITVPVLVDVGLKDHTCPPDGIKSVYGRIASREKHLKEFPEADHTDQGPQRWQGMVDFLAKQLSGP
jgi:cephalosporin-C deacetylase